MKREREGRRLTPTTRFGPRQRSTENEPYSRPDSTPTPAELQRAFGNRAVQVWLSTKNRGLTPLSRELVRLGLKGSGRPLPYLEAIQSSFGRHALDEVSAYVGGPAKEANERMGASAFTSGEDIAFKQWPDLRTAAHEAAHVVQQRADLRFHGGIGKADDRHERHADAVADAVVRGQSAESLLNQYGTGTRSVSREVRKVQFNIHRAVLMDPEEHFDSGALSGIPSFNAARAREDWFLNGVTRSEITTEPPYAITLFYADGNLLNLPLSLMEEGPGPASGSGAMMFRRHGGSGRVIPFFLPLPEEGESRPRTLGEAILNARPRLDRTTASRLLDDVYVLQAAHMGESVSEIIGLHTIVAGSGGASAGGGRLATRGLIRALAAREAAAVVAQGPHGVVRAGQMLRILNASRPHTTTLYTRLSRAPEAGALLSTTDDLALATAARSGGRTFIANIPTRLIHVLEEAGLVQRTITHMRGATAMELQFLPQGSDSVVSFFRVIS